MLSFALSICFFLLTTLSSAKSNIQCLNNDGKVVDWWFAYKSNHGTKYSYFDASSTESKLTPSTTQTLDAGNNSSLEQTLNQIYKNKKNTNFVAYNDENPNGTTSSTSGHSKSVLAFDDTNTFNGGFWLIQSVPKFPDLSNNEYEFASNGIIYGQNFLCISFNNISTINIVSNQIRYLSPFVYIYNNINDNDNRIDNFTAIASSKWLQGTSITNMTSTDGVIFTHLARSGSEDKDIFENIISDYYESSFMWETWLNEESAESSYCEPKYTFSEENIKKIVLGNDWYIDNNDDHSKFGISTNENSKNIVCSGDLNRATSQNPRGGGYACFENEKLWNAINNVINQVEQCQ